MHICSYLVHIHPDGHAGTVAEDINRLPGCQATPADNHDQLLVLVTETEDKRADNTLRHQLESIPSIDGLALVFGANDATENPPS